MVNEFKLQTKVPSALLERWKSFGALSRKCWDKVEAADHKKMTTAERFSMFWECMKTGDPVSPEEVRRCREAGIELAPHPICVMAEQAKGLSAEEAARKCLEEGRVHGISLLACRARLAGEM